MSRRTPLGRVLGLGSARDGTSHWWSQRVSAVALAPLGVWFVVSMAMLSGSGMDHNSLMAWLRAPLNTIGMLLFVATLSFHSLLGVQVVIEDYVHTEWLKIVSLIGLKFAHAALVVAGIYAIMMIAFGGSA